MPKKRHKPEEIVAKLSQVDVLASQGTPIADAIRQIGVTEMPYCRWRPLRVIRVAWAVPMRCLLFPGVRT